MTWRRSVHVIVVAALLAGLLAIGSHAGSLVGRALPAIRRQARALASAAPRELHLQVVRAYPHDPDAFTQGLVLDGRTLYESTGLAGRSTLRRVDLETGRVIDRVLLSGEFFGEGLAVLPGLLIQLTWKQETALVYDSVSFEVRRRIPYEGEGWGLCFDGQTLVMSDGSDRLTFRDPRSFDVTRTLGVTLSGEPLRRLNELECVDGAVYANVWHTDTIVRIDTATGRVADRIDASNLLTPAERQGADVLNGIAYDSASATFLITGKLWPKLFRVRFIAAAAAPGDTR
jgi:glutaminyl-peptide cyclotransferase